MPSRRARPALLTLLALLLALTACGEGGDPDLSVGEARAAVPAGGSSQIVVEIANAGDGDDTLLGADTDAATLVEIHRTEIDDGRATMRELDELVIPAGQTVQFRPGSLHLMIVAPDDRVVAGGTFELVLRFDRSGEIPVEVEVVPLADIVDDAVPE